MEVKVWLNEAEIKVGSHSLLKCPRPSMRCAIQASSSQRLADGVALKDSRY